MKHGQTLSADLRALALAHVRGYARKKRLCTEKRATEREHESALAVERALEEATADIRSAEVRKKLRDGLLRSCEDGRRWPYERLDVPTVSRKEFYKRRARMLAALLRVLGE